MTNATITLVPASAYRTEQYGVTFQSVTTHTIAGRGVHNRNSQHRIDVWDNTCRPRDDDSSDARNRPQQHLRHLPGCYIDPNGKPTDDAVSILCSAQASVISATPDPSRPPMGAPLAIGDVVTLQFPDGFASEYTVTVRPSSDPCLVWTRHIGYAK